MQINTNRTKNMTFTIKSSIPEYACKTNNIEIEKVESVKYFGGSFDFIAILQSSH